MVDTGSMYTLRFDGDYIYGEKDQPEDFRKLGIFRTFEAKKGADKYAGKIHFSSAWWRTNPYNGEKIVTERCTFEFPIEISLVSRNRIEGRESIPPDGTKPDKKKCTIPGDRVWQSFAMIPE
jgi:hypothetical protein